MQGRAATVLLSFVLAGACRSGPTTATITLDSGVRYQRMHGWEATAWLADREPGIGTVRSAVLENLVNDLGVTRLRLEVRSGSENPTDHFPAWASGEISYQTWRSKRYATTNDNGDPNDINPAGFVFGELDHTIEHIVNPFRRLVAQRGERPFINLCYVAFTDQIPPDGHYVHTDPREYGEFIEAVWRHISDKYGWVPDGLEIILEPDWVRQWSGTLIGQAIVEVARRLPAAGFAEPRFIAPSNTNMGKASRYFDEAMRVHGVPELLDEFSYHRYGGISKVNLLRIRARARHYAVETAMLETGAGRPDTLHEDLKVGGNSVWAEYGIAGHERGHQGQYYFVDLKDPARPQFGLEERSKFLRQYFRFIRPGAVRIEARTTYRPMDPVAFMNADGSCVVVVQAHRAGTINVVGLPPGEYGVTLTTDDVFAQTTPDSKVAAGRPLTATIPAAGVITIHGRK